MPLFQGALDTHVIGKIDVVRNEAGIVDVDDIHRNSPRWKARPSRRAGSEGPVLTSKSEFGIRSSLPSRPQPDFMRLAASAVVGDGSSNLRCVQVLFHRSKS